MGIAKMKHVVSNCCFLLGWTIVINLAYCQYNEVSPASSGHGLQCPLWFYFNNKTMKCECYSNPNTNGIVKCDEQEVQLKVSYCMTYEERDGIFLAHCQYFQSITDSFGYRITHDNYIKLPSNISELNDYMCGPIKRKGRLCSKCIDGFAPSVISLGSVCSNCTDAWYGIPLYLCLEFIPITLFYIMIVIFRINLTSAPMVAFVYFSQLEVSSFIFFGNKVFAELNYAHNFLLFLTTMYGFLNLDFLRYILPPFCVSPKIKIIHVTLLYYISAFYPLCLICITWLCIKLYSLNFKPIVCTWNKLKRLRCCHKFNASQDYSNSLINAFASFFLLSYAKVVFITSRMLGALKALNQRNYSVHTYLLATDPTFGYFSKRHLPYALVSVAIFLFAILPLIILLTLYPVKCFRSLLFKFLSTRAITSINIFVERYHSCYRDGTDGGKDMRSFVVLYFLLRLIVNVLFLFKFSTAMTFTTLLYGGCSVTIAILRPYKKLYMNIIDTLLLGNLALLTFIADQLYYHNIQETFLTLVHMLIFCTFVSIPLLGCAGFLTYQVLKRLARKTRFNLGKVPVWFLNKNIKRSKAEVEIVQDNRELEDSNNLELPDRVLHPAQYDLENYTHYTQYEDD